MVFALNVFGVQRSQSNDIYLSTDAAMLSRTAVSAAKVFGMDRTDETCNCSGRVVHVDYIYLLLQRKAASYSLSHVFIRRMHISFEMSRLSLYEGRLGQNTGSSRCI